MVAIDPRTALYLHKVTTAIESGKGEIPLTDICPECGDRIDTWKATNDFHLVMQVTSDVYAVLVGCEGYWVIDPNLVGIDSPDWSDGSALGDEVTGVHDAACHGDHPDTGKGCPA